MDKTLLRRWLQAGFIEKGTLFATEAGTPQGGIISPVVANMALDGLEAAVFASVGPTIHARRQFKINVVRYADDFVVTGISKEILEHKVLPAIRQFMAVRGLELSHEAITSRPLLLHGVATKTQHGGQTTLTITSQHAKQADSSRADASRGLP